MFTTGRVHTQPRTSRTFQEQPLSAHVPAFKSTEFQDREALELEFKSCRRTSSSYQSSALFQVLLPSPAPAGLRFLPSWLSSCCSSQGTPASLISGHFAQTFLTPDLLKYFVYLAAAVPIVPKLFFLLNYRGFELE